MTNLSSYFGTKNPGYYGFEQKYVLRRLKSARECADRGGRLMELAKAWGVTYHGAYNFLVKHDLELLKRVLANGPVTFQVSSEEAQRRIKTCFDHLK